MASSMRRTRSLPTLSKTPISGCATIEAPPGTGRITERPATIARRIRSRSGGRARTLYPCRGKTTFRPILTAPSLFDRTADAPQVIERDAGSHASHDSDDRVPYEPFFAQAAQPERPRAAILPAALMLIVGLLIGWGGAKFSEWRRQGRQEAVESTEASRTPPTAAEPEGRPAGTRGTAADTSDRPVPPGSAAVTRPFTGTGVPVTATSGGSRVVEGTLGHAHGSVDAARRRSHDQRQVERAHAPHACHAIRRLRGPGSPSRLSNPAGAGEPVRGFDVRNGVRAIAA